MEKTTQDGEVIAFLLLATESDLTEKTLQYIRDLDEVVEAYIIYGEWDVITKVKIPSLPELTKLVMKLRNKAGIQKTSTLITLSN